MEQRYARTCPVSDTLKLLGNKWAVQLILELGKGDTHFEQLRKALAPITAKTLSKRLAELVQQDMVAKTAVTGTGFGKTRYALTLKSRGLFAIIRAGLCSTCDRSACTDCRGISSCATLSVSPSI